MSVEVHAVHPDKAHHEAIGLVGEEELAGYVDTTTAQTVGGAKNFTTAPTVNGVPIGAGGGGVPNDGSVTDAKVAAGAAIAPTKIAGTAVVTADTRLSDKRIPVDGSVGDTQVSAISQSKVTGLTGALSAKQDTVPAGTYATYTEGLASARPAATAVPAQTLYLATDTNGGTLYRSNGSTWRQLAAGVTSGGGAAGVYLGLTAPASIVRGNLPKGSLDVWRAARDASASALCEVAVTGDSTAIGVLNSGVPTRSWATEIRAKSILAGFTDGGKGIIGSQDEATQDYTGITGEVSGVTARTGFAAAPQNKGDVMSTHSYRSTTTGDTIQFSFKGTWGRLYFGRQMLIQSAFRYRVDAGAWTTVVPAAFTAGVAAAAQEQIDVVLIGSPTPLADALHTVDVENLGYYPSVVPTITLANGGGGGSLITAKQYAFRITGSVTGTAVTDETAASAIVNTTLSGGATKVTVNLNTSQWPFYFIYYRNVTDGGAEQRLTVATAKVANSSGGALKLVDGTEATTATSPPSSGLVTNNTSMTEVSRLCFAGMKAVGIVWHKYASGGTYSTHVFNNGDWNPVGVLSYGAEWMMGLGATAPNVVVTPGPFGKAAGTGAQYSHPALLVWGGYVYNDLTDMANAGLGFDYGRIAGSLAFAIQTARAAGSDFLAVIGASAVTHPQWQVWGGQFLSCVASVCNAEGVAWVDAATALGPPAQWVTLGYVVNSANMPHLTVSAYNLIGDYLWNEVLSK